jgi:hypothetical protein
MGIQARKSIERKPTSRGRVRSQARSKECRSAILELRPRMRLAPPASSSKRMVMGCQSASAFLGIAAQVNICQISYPGKAP